jgi:hypothetical protein
MLAALNLPIDVRQNFDALLTVTDSLACDKLSHNRSPLRMMARQLSGLSKSSWSRLESSSGKRAVQVESIRPTLIISSK